MLKKVFLFYSICFFPGLTLSSGQEAAILKIVKPVEIHDVLNNPGIGFMTFQRFNGDKLNDGMGWTEGYPIVYQDFNGSLINKDHPQTSIAYFRVYWNFVEPEQGQYNWAMIDKALKTAAERGQTLMLRIPPYNSEVDVPGWYRKIVGREVPSKIAKWRVDHEDPNYLKYYGGMIRALGERYDGHPDLESVDVSLVGYWGEGEGTHLLTEQTRVALINVYLDNFNKTFLTFQPLNGDAPDAGVLVKNTNIAAFWPDGRNNGTGPQMRHLGWRLDCLGDMGFWPDWNHMTDIYPRDIVKSGMNEAWKKAPVTMEICGTFLRWLEKEKYNKDTVKYIFEQALKWHISSFNAKSSAVPEIYSPLVNEWLNKMGYRFVLRRFTYPSSVKLQGQLPITSWWENKGVAPIYKDYKFAVRLKNEKETKILVTSAYLPDWFPGDIVHDEILYVPHDMQAGNYKIEIAIVSPVSFEPRVKLAISGANDDGWYYIGDIMIQQNN
ncbi:MAG TPA: DUF4832 domain-containing protein [Bacteroidales bacterium]|nr:DUF4832 domain-containing protein [Bacteroidales bacterium]